MDFNQVDPNLINYNDTFQFTGNNVKERIRVRDELIAEGTITNKGEHLMTLDDNQGGRYNTYVNAGTHKTPYLPIKDYEVHGLVAIMWICIIALIICLIIYFTTSGETKENTLIALIISAVIIGISILMRWYYSNKKWKLSTRFQVRTHIIEEIIDSYNKYFENKKIPNGYYTDNQLNEYLRKYKYAYLTNYDKTYSYIEAEQAAMAELNKNVTYPDNKI